MSIDKKIFRVLVNYLLQIVVRVILKQWHNDTQSLCSFTLEKTKTPVIIFTHYSSSVFKGTQDGLPNEMLILRGPSTEGLLGETSTDLFGTSPNSLF